MKSELVSLIVKAVREVGELGSAPLPATMDGETPLFGRAGLLDSLGLATLTVAVEQASAAELRVSVSLADERALTQRTTPHSTAGTLPGYAASPARAAGSDAA